VWRCNATQHHQQYHTYAWHNECCDALYVKGLFSEQCEWFHGEHQYAKDDAEEAADEEVVWELVTNVQLLHNDGDELCTCVEVCKNTTTESRRRYSTAATQLCARNSDIELTLHRVPRFVNFFSIARRAQPKLRVRFVTLFRHVARAFRCTRLLCKGIAISQHMHACTRVWTVLRAYFQQLQKDRENTD